MQKSQSLRHQVCRKERVCLRGSQRRRSEGKPEICLLVRGREQVFYNYTGWDYTHIDEKSRETYDYSWGKIEHVCWANICNGHTISTLGWRQNWPLTSGGNLRTRRREGLKACSESPYKLGRVLSSLYWLRNPGPCLFTGCNHYYLTVSPGLCKTAS